MLDYEAWFVERMIFDGCVFFRKNELSILVLVSPVTMVEIEFARARERFSTWIRVETVQNEDLASVLCIQKKC